MTIYISGAITGLPNNNEAAFKDAHLRIAHIAKANKDFVKIKILNPHKIAASLRGDFTKKNKGEPAWTDYMRTCIQKLCEADCVFFLKDWAQSKGASLERHIAGRLDIPLADNIDVLKEVIKRFVNS